MDTTTGVATDSRNYFKGLDDMIADVKYMLPRCDAEITIRKTLAEVAQQFCRDTGVFTCVLELAAVQDRLEYFLEPPFPADILHVNEIRVFVVANGAVETLSQILSPLSYEIVDDPQDDGVTLKLATPVQPATGYTTTIKVELAMVPYLDQMLGTEAYALPDKVLRRWRAAFVSGAISQLAMMDNRPWTNKSLALDRRAQYTALQGEALNKANVNKMRKGIASCLNSVGFV